MRRLVRRLLRLLALGALLGSFVLAWLIWTPARHEAQLPPIDEFRALDQGWGTLIESGARGAYYYGPIGTSLAHLRYDWLVALEMPWGRRRFAAPEHMRSYGFVVDPHPTSANPDQLPVGFARRFDPGIGEAVVDINCAACHTGELVTVRDGRRIAVRIDGGPAAHAFTVSRRGHFLPTLTAALASTYLDPLKFRRFGRKVLGEPGFARGRWRLHSDLGDVVLELARRSWRERHGDLYPVEEGYGRTDVVARAANRLLGEELRGANRVTGGAPVRYASLWNAWKRSQPQYPTGVSQPMAHGMLEALPAGAEVALLDRYGRPVPVDERYRTSLDLEGLHRMDAALQRLRPPRWPEEVFGRIDRGKAEWGRRLFERHCARCHGMRELPAAIKSAEAPGRTASDPLWETRMVALDEIGTDPQAARLAAGTVDLRATGLDLAEVRATFSPVLEEQRRRLGVLEQAAAALERAGDPSQVRVAVAWQTGIARLDAFTHQLDALDLARVPLETALHLVSTLARERRYQRRGFTRGRRDCLDGFGALDLPPTAQPAYQAPPLAGVWARGPFLHNGSVPTLFQLLSPHDERSERFLVSPGAFDPVAVGVDLRAEGDGFWFDTHLPGNSNVGHEFRAGYAGEEQAPQYGVIGPALTVAERWALVEYLKVHADPATLPDRVPPECGVQGEEEGD